MSERGVALIVVLAAQAILALMALHTIQHLRLQQQVLGHDLARTIDRHRADATLAELLATIASAPQSVIAHPHRALGIEPNDCTLQGWLTTRPDGAPWQPVAPTTPLISAATSPTRVDRIVIDWAGSGCQHRKDTTVSWHAVVRVQRPGVVPWYRLAMLSGEARAPSHGRVHR